MSNYLGDYISTESLEQEYKIDDYSLIIIPGGVKCIEHLRLQASLIKDIEKFNSKGKLIAAICSGTMMLISANIMTS